MRRVLSLVLVALTLGCGSDFAPVSTVDGLWTGIQNGFSMSIQMVQTGSTVTGTMNLAGVSGFGQFDVTGTFDFPNLSLTVNPSDAQSFTYTGTMSQTAAKINGQLNGSGFTNLEVDIAKK